MTPQEKLNWAVWYALKQGCFFPVPDPADNANVETWRQWGAMRHLHEAIREFYPHSVEPRPMLKVG